jgi:hypothetical protein
MLNRKCEQCNSVMKEDMIKLASERRLVIAYYCSTCGRLEYGRVISRQRNSARSTVPGGDRVLFTPR